VLSFEEIIKYILRVESTQKMRMNRLSIQSCGDEELNCAAASNIVATDSIAFG